MNLPENIFEESLKRLRSGEDAFHVAQSHGNYSDELLELMTIAQTVRSIPKLDIPVPNKQFKFAEVRTMPYLFAEFMSLFRVAIIPIGLVVILLGGRIVASAAENSLPGDTFYSLKRATETARLTMALDQEKAANIQVELIQKRLAEVKKAVDTNNPATEAAAITALKEQSEKTFATVPQVAAANALANKGQELLNNLVAVNKEQKSVLTAINDQHDNKEATVTALNNAKANDKTLAKIIATVNDQTLVDLPNKISVTGDITLMKDNKITVEKNTFSINDHTYITDLDGIKLDNLKNLVGRVTIVGTRSTQGLIAKQITMIAVEVKPAETAKTDGKTETPPSSVKGAVTTKSSTNTDNAKSPATATVLPAPQTETPAPPTNQASGTFIAEPVDQQYAP